MTKNIEGAEKSVLKKEAIGFASQISEMAKALRSIPGLKNIILFSSGIPNYALYGGEWGYAALRDRYNEMCKELAGSNSAVYAVNVSSASSAPFDETDMKDDGALRQLARESGGRYFDNINSYETINRTIQKVTGAYYVLGYYIGQKWDGRFHGVRIEVKRKGCSVFGQQGYFNPKPFVPLKVAAHNLEKDRALLVFVVPVRPGRTVCRIALYNMETGFSVRGAQTIDVPEAREAALWLDPCLRLSSTNSWTAR